MKSTITAAVGLLALAHAGISEPQLLEPTPFPENEYRGTLLGGSYDPAVPTPESLLGFPVGQRPATPEQIVAAVRAWDEASDRAVAVEYARSHEGRPLYYVMISTPANLARVDEVKAGIGKLADPRGVSQAETERIIGGLPAVAWMAYSIHGNESSGADAALAAIYHLVASTGDDVASLLDDMIVLIDPSMNPDGRARFTRSLEGHRGAAPNVDSQSLLHTGFWPYGRTNHYLFDLNRDFFFLVHPETRGRVRAINEWHPQIIIDGHEMGSEETYLFSPAREPINRHVPDYLRQYGQVFAADQAAAFDAHAWPYYTGEWNDNFYPGYSSYAMFRGSLFILYEQARTAEDGVRLPEGTVRTYRQSVHHQLVSTMANLESLAANSTEMYRRFAADRRQVLASDSPYANVTYAVLPSDNASRWHLLAEKLLAQGFEVFVADADLRVTDVTRMDGATEARATIPAGSLVIPNRQPEARLLAAILEFDAEISEEALVAERQEILRTGGGTMYDVTAWNLEMMYGLEAIRVPDHLDSGLSPYERPPAPAALAGASDAIAWVVDGADDRSLAFAARLMEQGVRVRMVDKATTLDGVDVSRGSILVGTNDNPGTDLAGPVAAAAGAVGVTATGIGGGLGEGDLPDIGGRHFGLLQRPRVAVLSRDGNSAYDFGAIWHSLDSNLGIRHSHLDQAVLGRLDLRRYNVFILPDRRRGGMPAAEVQVLDAWVKAGGTLIAVKGAVPALVDPETGISSVRLLGDTFADAGRYDVSLQREWLALESELPDADAIRSHAVPLEVEDPLPDPSAMPGEEELKQRDGWQAIFMPGGGAVMAGRVDPRDWLTAGVPETLPVLYGNGLVLMSDDASRAVVRMGVLKDSSGGKAGAARLGWATIPEGRELWLRMSGLVWPEAQQRIANSAYVTRERVGNGQIILFADTPVFRGATLGTARLLLNAVVYGPGLGTRAVVEP